MKTLLSAIVAVVLGMSVVVGDAEAKRLGGGKSVGMQRESVKPAAPAATPSPTTPSSAAPAAPLGAAGAAAAATPKRSWMGPLAGLAAGLGLAALASHFGFGEGLANFMMIALLVLAVVVVLRLVFRRKAGDAPTMQYAGAGPGNLAPPLASDAFPGSASRTSPAPTAATRIPAGFDVETFTRQAKLNFIRLQAANDSGNLDDLRDFTTPEMFAEIRLALSERGGAKQQTDVVTVNADVLEVAEEAGRYIVSVHFHGLLREEANAAAEPFDEIWHLTKPIAGGGGWVIAGIQQTH